MWKWLVEKFRGKTSIPPERDERDDPFDQLVWLEADQNPFGVRVLDCTPTATSLLSTTTDQAVALKFSQLRNSLGTEHIGQFPANAGQSPAILIYPSDGKSKDGPLFTASEMEDKWDICLYDGILYFSRSWNGMLVFRASIHIEPGKAVVRDISFDPDFVNGDEVFAVRQVDFLIKSHLYGEITPHPLPGRDGLTPQEIAMFSFQLFGRLGRLATFEDTTRLRPS